MQTKFNIEKLNTLISNLKEKKTVDVGIFKDKSIVDGNIDLAGIGLVQEKGSVINNTPPRSFLETPLQERLSEDIKNANLLDENLEIDYNSIGKEVQQIVKNSFDTFGGRSWSKNALITIHGGWMKNKKSGKPFKAEGKGFDAPLTNTGRLKNSMDYRVVKD
ncbi:MAG: hypothetical protein LBR79_04315 [Oscillospiraceae bacterium]|jgi:hypothetical protein|nr:hypothetical protein [Oscillospiraceae bacterium]